MSSPQLPPSCTSYPHPNRLESHYCVSDCSHTSGLISNCYAQALCLCTHRSILFLRGGGGVYYALQKSNGTAVCFFQTWGWSSSNSAKICFFPVKHFVFTQTLNVVLMRFFQMIMSFFCQCFCFLIFPFYRHMEVSVDSDSGFTCNLKF